MKGILTIPHAGNHFLVLDFISSAQDFEAEMLKHVKLKCFHLLKRSFALPLTIGS